MSDVHNDVAYSETPSTVRKQSCDYPAVHNDATERRSVLEAWLVSKGVVGGVDSLIAADPLTAAHAEAAALLADARKTLMQVRDAGLIYWEPNTARGFSSKAKMLGDIDALLSRIEGVAK